MRRSDVPLPGAFSPAVLGAIMVTVMSGEYHEIRVRGWRWVTFRLVRPAPVMNVIGWFDCSVPGTRGRLGKLMEPDRWRQA